VSQIQIVSSILCGHIAFLLDLSLKRVFWDVLPYWIRYFLLYGTSPAPLFVGLGLGLGSLALLGALECGGEKRKAYIPICLTIALTLAWLQLFLAIIAALQSLDVTSHGVA